MTYRCITTDEPHADVWAMAKEIPSFYADIQWCNPGEIQCVVEDVEHDFHAGFLRSGAGEDTDVFLCWVPGRGQWLMDVECCLKTRTELGGACTIYRGHPGKCDWAYVDPPAVAVAAIADQLLRHIGFPPRRRVGE